MKRLSPRAIDGATSRTLLVVNDPETILRQAVAAGATQTSPVGDEHPAVDGGLVAFGSPTPGPLDRPA
jgi:hypothetical protein